MTALLEQARTEWEREVFWIGTGGEPFWPRACYRPFSQWLAEDVQPDRDRDRDDGDEHDLPEPGQAGDG